MFQIVVKSGMKKGASWPVEDHTLTIGRETGCEIRIPDPVVSRRHCELTLIGGEVHLHDLDSLNPPLVNGRPVADCTLQPGDEIRVGRVLFLVTLVNQESQESIEDMSAHATNTLAEEESAFLSSPDTSRDNEVRPQTNGDLDDLFRFSRTLSRKTSQAELINALGEAVHVHFSPDHAWLLLVLPKANDLIYLGGSGDVREATKTPSQEWMMSLLSERRGVLLPERVSCEDGKTTMCILAAPIYFGGQNIGVLALRKQQQTRAYQNRDLHFFVALAHVIAPFFKAIERVEELEAENRRLSHASEKFTRLVGSSKAMAQVQRLIRVAAPTMQRVLILGPTGTGKEVVASLVHELSSRARGPLVTVNCAAIPRDLFESEFFGHEKGAFTGAAARKAGLLEQSHGGTLFLDEIGDLSLEHQARILRALETGRFRRVGGEEEVIADFRVVAATNKEPAAQIKQGLFREDLYHRLRGVEINVPPLVQRRCDIPELAQHFLELIAIKTGTPPRKISPKAMEYLLNLRWSGNVRELKNTIEVANSMCQVNTIDVDDVRTVACAHDIDNEPMTLAEIERLHILKAIEFTNANMSDAARLLGVSRSTLYNKLAQYGVRP